MVQRETEEVTGTVRGRLSERAAFWWVFLVYYVLVVGGTTLLVVGQRLEVSLLPFVAVMALLPLVRRLIDGRSRRRDRRGAPSRRPRKGAARDVVRGADHGPTDDPGRRW